ncbi:serum response factor homolog isoform X2 [Culex quinquefasciatus]|uniref:serum response factor homolog isoform X2 n=1 Tax=Culex quinquefasciatus TaxID=7176 RepID=UPI0018E2E115|nr:serum response factor homolog isoform X2 [Culex quinquefasciatus]
MDPNAARDSRYNLNYSMSMMSETPEIYGNPNVSLARPPSGGLVGQVMSRGGQLMSANGPQCGSGAGGGGGGGGGGLSGGRGIKRANSDCYDDGRQLVGSQSGGMTGLEGCQVGGSDVVDESYTSLQPKKSPPSNGKKTKGRVKIKMEYIDNKLRRYTTFSKRKTGIMKKAYELSTLTGTQVMLLVASETGHVYTFATRKLQPMITSEAGKALIQTCLNSPDPPTGSTGDQRMSATGFEETELSYNIGDEDSKDDRSPMSSGSDTDDYSPPDSPGPSCSNTPLTSSSSTSTSTAARASASSVVASVGNGAGSGSGLGATIQQQIKQHQALQQQIQQQQSSTSAHQQQQATQQQVTSNVIYPAAALANLPQDVLMSLLQTGQIQLHNEDGVQQYITIPLSLMSTLNNASKPDPKNNSNSNGSANQQSANAKPNSATTNRSSPSSSSSSRKSSSASSKEITIKTEVND